MTTKSIPRQEGEKSITPLKLSRQHYLAGLTVDQDGEVYTLKKHGKVITIISGDNAPVRLYSAADKELEAADAMGEITEIFKSMKNTLRRLDVGTVLIDYAVDYHDKLMAGKISTLRTADYQDRIEALYAEGK
jgi:hypothetical protein